MGMNHAMMDDRIRQKMGRIMMGLFLSYCVRQMDTQVVEIDGTANNIQAL